MPARYSKEYGGTVKPEAQWYLIDALVNARALEAFETISNPTGAS
jgi:hypothetical protein